MDEKFLDLRNKLDYARESSLKKVDRDERIARELRMKFALGSSIGGRGSTANRNMNLDKIELPDIFTTGPIGMKFMYFFIIYVLKKTLLFSNYKYTIYIKNIKLC